MLENAYSLVANAGSPIHEGSVCPACYQSGHSDFFELRDVPVYVGLLYDSFEEAARVPLGDITLSYCHACGLIFNRQFDSRCIEFQPGYQAALHYSPSVRAFLIDVAADLIQRFQLRGKRISEIGCGDGYFLRLLCEKGGNFGIGVDPTIGAESLELIGNGSIRWIPDQYQSEHADLEADFICCRSVFEDIAAPAAFLKMLRQGLGDRRVGLYFEVFNGMRSLEREEIWSIHYEQCNYFSRESLAGLFERSGFEILNCGASFQGDQFLFVEATPKENGSIQDRHHSELNGYSLPGALGRMAETFSDRRNFWNEKFKSFHERGVKVAAWGTGGKGITFLNSVQSRSVVPFVVDINPSRQNKFIPKSGQRTIGPEALRDYRPEVIVITNRLYEAEIRQQVAELGLQCEFLCA